MDWPRAGLNVRTFLQEALIVENGKGVDEQRRRLQPMAQLSDGLRMVSKIWSKTGAMQTCSGAVTWTSDHNVM